MKRTFMTRSPTGAAGNEELLQRGEIGQVGRQFDASLTSRSSTVTTLLQDRRDRHAHGLTKLGIEKVGLLMDARRC